jgi:hypothetical protein
LARLASPDIGGLPKQHIRSPERPLSPRLAQGRWLQASPRRIGVRPVPCRMGIRRGNHGASCLQSVLAEGGCSPQKPLRHRLSSRVGWPRRPCSSSLHRGTGVWQPPFGGMPWHTVPLRERAGDPSGDRRRLAPPRSSLLHRAALTGRAVLRRPPSVRLLSTGAPYAEAQGARPASGWNPLGGAGCVVARKTRVSAGCVQRPLRSTTSVPKVPLHRVSILHRGLSAAGFIGPPRSTGFGAARRFAAQVPVVKQPNGLLLHRASPSMRCPRAG